jgi:branched-chain amino acid transport system permease protein
MNLYIAGILITIEINTILALSLYCVISTGQFSLAHGAFMGIGAYISSVLTVNFHVPLGAALLIAALISGGFGIIVGFPALRLRRNLYLAISTLGFGEIMRVVFLNTEYIGAATGFRGMKGTSLSLATGVVVILIISVYFVERSRLGLAREAVRYNPDVTSMMGLNVTRIKVTAFAQGAFMAGLAGGLYAHYAYFIEPSTFGFFGSLIILFFVIFGGGEVLWGSIIGAIILTALLEILRFTLSWRIAFYGAIIIIIMLVRPQGLVDKNLINWISDSVRGMVSFGVVREGNKQIFK